MLGPLATCQPIKLTSLPCVRSGAPVKYTAAKYCYWAAETVCIIMFVLVSMGSSRDRIQDARCRCVLVPLYNIRTQTPAS